MSKHTISFGLSPSSIDDALKELEAYSKRFSIASALFCQKLARMGIRTIDEHYNAAPGDADKSHTTGYIEVERNSEHAVYKILLSGAAVLFVEFGAGVYYNDAFNKFVNFSSTKQIISPDGCYIKHIHLHE